MGHDQKVWKGLASFLQLSYLILIPIVLCTLLGKWLESLWDTGGILMVILILLGIAGGLRNLYMWALAQVHQSKKDEKRRGFDEGDQDHVRR